MGQVGEKEYDDSGSSGTENPEQRITPEQARLVLLEHGMEVSLEQADAILAFLRRFASISNANHSRNG